MKKYTCLFFLLWITNIPLAFSQSENLEQIQFSLENEIDSTKGCFSFDLASPSAIWDSTGKIVSFQHLLYFENERIRKIIINNSKDINYVLLKMLKSKNIRYSWAAVVLLTYSNARDATSLFRYTNDDCKEWFKKERKYYIKLWEKRILK